MEAARNDNAVSKIDYEALEKERLAEVQRAFQVRLNSEFGGRIDSLRQMVLRSVVAGDYKIAVENLDGYIHTKDEYPNFAPRVRHLVVHARELINAIRAKRNFPGITSLPMSKQKEIMDNVVGHFEELKFTLRSIEKVAKDVALGDIRSTVWLIKTVSYMTLFLFGTAFAMSFNREIGQPFWSVFGELTQFLTDKVFTLLGM